MEFSLTRGVAARLIVLEETTSTNDELLSRAAAEELPEFTVVATLNQTAGRGRLGRAWLAPAGTALAASVLLRPERVSLPEERYGWLPLIAGLAMSRAVRSLLPAREVSVKWPNDVLIESKKVCGLLSELLPSGAVVVGSGVNLTIPADDLPVPTATSLLLCGATAPAAQLADRVLSRYLSELESLWNRLTADDAESLHDIRRWVGEECSTLGRPVRVLLPDGSESLGTALDLDEAGRLRVRWDADDSVQAVAAGDVTHVRYE